MAHCRSGRVARRPVHWVPRPGGRPRGAYRRQYRAACCCEDKRTCWTRGQCGNARGQCGLGGSYLNQVYRRDDHGVFVIHTVLEVPPRRCVHPAAHPPRLSTAVARPAREPHGEEPPPNAPGVDGVDVAHPRSVGLRDGVGTSPIPLVTGCRRGCGFRARRWHARSILRRGSRLRRHWPAPPRGPPSSSNFR
jgi:hypothetical protein